MSVKRASVNVEQWNVGADDVSVSLDEIAKTKRELDDARAHGDKLRIELAEAALNDLLDRLAVELRV